MLSYREPSITQLRSEVLSRADVTILVVHEYQNHPLVSGNKWWKLRDNLVEASRYPGRPIVTFGGPYSNHIFATAAAARLAGLPSIGVIRGERVENKTLAFARSQGMELQFISREEYRQKSELHYQKTLSMRFGEHYLIPEGGTNTLAVNACVDWARKLQTIDYTTLMVATGTAGTLAGLVKGSDGREVVGIPVLKNDGFLEASVRELAGSAAANWRLINDYHFGGYGKAPAVLQTFCSDFHREYGFTIEPLYTGKLFFAVFDQVRRGLVPRGATILVVHTGGLQYL